jgi:choline kinase
MSRAVILAAGSGTRLRPHTDDRPKALVEVHGEPLLLRLARQLAAVGVADLVIATGYREETVSALLPRLPIPAVLARNSAYATTQNIVSFYGCAPYLRDGETWKLDGDLLLDDTVLERLARAPMRDDELLCAIDRRRDLGAEEMKVELDGTRIARFGKAIDPKRAAGESAGIERIGSRALSSIVDAMGAAVTAGETHLYYEDIYDRLVHGRALRAIGVDISDLRWTEIDTPEDLARAARIAGGGA